MRVLGRGAARTTLVAASLILALASVAGAVRVLPWLVAPDVPWRVAVPFARALFGVALETALLCGPPIGWALAAARLLDRGEARAFFANGVSPAGLVRGTAGHAAACALFAAVAALTWGAEAQAPGRMVRAIVQQSKQACGEVSEDRVFHVPFIGATWLCSAGVVPRVIGTLPRSAGEFSAEDLSISDDLRALELTNNHMLLAAQGGQLHIGQTRVRGLSPWGRASNLTPWCRSLLVSATGATLALAVAWLVLARQIGSRIAALFLGCAGPVATVLTMSRLEAGEHGLVAYLAVPLTGALSVLAAQLTLLLGARLASERARRKAPVPSQWRRSS